jgi:hypothetical protein
MRINDDCNEDLRLLCLCIPTADDQLIEKLKDMIDSNQWLVDYTIQRVIYKIYLQYALFLFSYFLTMTMCFSSSLLFSICYLRAKSFFLDSLLDE